MKQSLFLVVGATALASASFAQGVRGSEDAPFRADEPELALQRYVLEGVVSEPDGAPAAGATVVTSAGGLAVADADGRYRVEVEVAPDAASVQVDAASHAGARRAASATVALSAGPGPVQVGALVLLGSASCAPSWVPTFGEQPGPDGELRAFATFDDGGGPALYVGGRFASAGGIEAFSVARWDGASWSAVGDGNALPLHSDVAAMAVHDDGSGPALFVGGRISSVGGAPTSCVAKWDGTSWSALGGGIGGFSPEVFALAVFDDGSGPALFAGGNFTSIGGVSALRVAKWDGSTWSALGSGLSGGPFFPPAVRALAVHDDGGGPALYAAGNFASSGALAVHNVARWDGSGWSALGSGLSSVAYALAVFDDGGGAALFAGGAFGIAGGIDVDRVAKWDGSSWAPLASGVGSGVDSVECLTVHDDGGGAALYAGGDFSTAGGAPADGLARWNGASWQEVGGGLPGALALTSFDDGGGPVLLAGGSFALVHGTPVSSVVEWNGSTWGALGGGASWVNGEVRALAEYDDGSGPALYAGGAFSSVGSLVVNGLARWDGAGWESLGLDTSVYGYVSELEVYDDGGGAQLYAAGNVPIPGGNQSIARWDGASWSAIGAAGIDVRALAVYDDGSGAALFAAGGFASIGGIAANDIARWDGSSWAALGSGLQGIAVEALVVHDDGSGPALFVGGEFGSAGGVTANRVAKWDGSAWSAVGSPPYGSVGALTSHGGDLYVGGSFPTLPMVPRHSVSRWDGATWTPLSTGGGAVEGMVYSLITHDDGNGPALVAAGSFFSANGLAVGNVATWDGSSWSALGRGANGLVRDLLSRSDDGWPALYVAGAFGSAPDSGDAGLAKWGCLDLPPVLECPRAVHVVDALDGPPGATVAYAVSATDDHDPAPGLVCVPTSGSFFPRGTTIVTCTATDANGHVSTCEFPVVVATKVQHKSR